MVIGQRGYREKEQQGSGDGGVQGHCFLSGSGRMRQDIGCSDRWRRRNAQVTAVGARQDAIAKDPDAKEGQPTHVWYLAGGPSIEHKSRWAGVADPRVREGNQWVIKR